MDSVHHIFGHFYISYSIGEQGINECLPFNVWQQSTLYDIIVKQQ